MKSDFLDLLHTEGYTIQKLADGICASRSRVNGVLLNRGGGGHIRPKLAKFFKANFVTWPAMLACLGWKEKGTFHVEQSK